MTVVGRLSLRLRLTLLFGAAMAVVLAGVGLFVHARLAASLLEQVDDRLDSRAGGIAAEIRAGALPTTLPGSDEEFAQVMDADGRVLASSPGLPRPVLIGPQLPGGTDADIRVTRHLTPPGESAAEPTRLFARRNAGTVIVVGAGLDDRAEALDQLRAQLALVVPLALLLSSFAGYMLAGVALRPVAAMRRRATQVSAENSAQRLPLPRARDEVHRLGESLNTMLDRLDAGLRRERRFVAEASHELRTPLALLRTELDLALRRSRSKAELNRTLRSVAEEIDRLSQLADALLLLATYEDGRLPLQVSTVAVPDLLAGVARQFTTRATQAGRLLVVDAPRGLAVEGDRLRLEQALVNLVDNALRYGGGQVMIEATTADFQVRLVVQDEGAGFPLDFLPRAFERFSRSTPMTPPVGPSGAGLGLAIVDAVARSHDGSVTAGNRPTGGAWVELCVPTLRRSRST